MSEWMEVLVYQIIYSRRQVVRKQNVTIYLPGNNIASDYNQYQSVF